MRRVHLLLSATSWLVSVADRSRLEIGNYPAQDGVVAVAVGHRHQELSPARSRTDLEHLAKDVATPRIVQSARLRPDALAKVQSSLSDESATLLPQHWHNVTDSRGLPADQSTRVSKEAAWTIGKGRKDADEAVHRKDATTLATGSGEDVLQAEDEPGASLKDEDARPRGKASTAFMTGGSSPAAVLQADMQESGRRSQARGGDNEAAARPSSRSRGQGSGGEDSRERRKIVTRDMKGGSDAVLQGTAELITMMRSSDKGDRRHALSAIGRGGSKPVLLAIDDVKALLNDAEDSVRTAAAMAIKSGGPEAVLHAVGELQDSLKDESPGVRKNSASAIETGGSTAVLQAIVELKALLKDEDTGVRKCAASAIGAGRSMAVQQAAGELRALLRDKDAAVRMKAAWAIARGGREAGAVPPALGELKVLLQDEDAKVRRDAAWALGRGGPETALQAVGGLKALLQDADGAVRDNAAWALGVGEREAVLQAMGEVKAFLQDKDAKVRGKAAKAIGMGGHEAVLQALGELKAALLDANHKPREQAAEAIGRGGERVVLQSMGELKAALRDKEAVVRLRAANSIGRGGGSEAVLQATEDLEALLQDADALVREAAAKALGIAGADVVAHAAASILPSLGVGKNAETRSNAADIVMLLGPAAIEDTLPALREMLGESPFAHVAANSTEAQIQQQVPASAARALRKYCRDDKDRAPVDMFPDLKSAEQTLKLYAQEFPLFASPGALQDVEIAVGALTKLLEDRCMEMFEKQVHDLLLVTRWEVETPRGRMVNTFGSIGSAGRGLEAHRCPNNAACPGETFNVTYAANTVTGPSSSHNFTCPLARTCNCSPPCSNGYDSSVAGCAGCLNGWGRSSADAFTCQKCGDPWLQWTVWLARPSAMLAISMWSAKKAAMGRGDAAGFANDVLKIALSFSTTSVVIISSLATTWAYHDMQRQMKELLGWFSDTAQSGEPSGFSSADCLIGRELSLNELLALSIANPAIVLAAAALILGTICIIRRWQGEDSSFAEDLKTLGVVSGNLFLPGIAAACAMAVPCFHTQTGDVAGESLMSFSPSESCDKRVLYMAMRAPVLALAFAAGPGLWFWLLRRRAGERREQFFRFLTASYRPENVSWEVNRLARNMVMKCVVAVSPVSYAPGLQLTLAECLMFSFTAWHLRNQPYKLDLLNIVEAISLWVLNLCMMASTLAVSASWHLTPEFRVQLIIGVYGLLGINALGLALLFLWAKFMLDDDHKIFKP